MKNTKKIAKNSIFNLKFEKQICNAPINRETNFGWVAWGKKNNYPYLLLDLYNQSPTLHTCIQFAIQAILGDGVDVEAMKIDSNDCVPNYYETWPEFIRKISLDYMLYGSYAIQIIKNRNNTDYSFYHVPLEQVRYGKYDEDGCITEYYICQDWSATGKYQPIRLDAFEMRDDMNIAQGKPYLYVYRTYTPSQAYYTTPVWNAAIKAVQAEIEINNFDLKFSTNGFTPSGVLTLHDVENDKDRQEIVDNVNKMFVGTDNANSLMITFRNREDEKPVEFTPFTTNNENVNIYSDSANRQIDRILSSFLIPSRSLVGLPDVGGSGFNSEAQMLETAYNLYNKLIGNHNRDCIINTLNYMFKMNGIDTKVILKPLTFLNDTSNAQTNENIEVNKDLSSNNVEEQVTSIK